MANNKSILIVSGIFPPDIGGPATYAQNVATDLHKKGIPVAVASYSKKFNTKESDSKYTFNVIRVWGGWPIWIKHAIFGIKLMRIVPKYDLVFALNIWNAGFPARLVARMYRKKFIVKIVGDYAWESAVGKGKTNLLIDEFQNSKKSGWIGILYKLQAKICKGAEAIIVPSEYLAGIVEGWGIPKTKIKVIYNGVDFKPSELSKEEAKRKINLTGNILFSWGRLVPWKGFRMLIKIMPKLSEINQFFKLVIVGEGPDRTTLEMMIKNMGLDKKVILAGRKTHTEIAEYLNASDLAILNSGYEGFSHQILEAMTAGTPVIASASGGNREVIHQGENGFMIKYNDEFNLIEAIRTLWNHPETREHFVQEGKKTIEYFTVEKMFTETINFLTNV